MSICVVLLFIVQKYEEKMNNHRILFFISVFFYSFAAKLL